MIGKILCRLSLLELIRACTFCVIDFLFIILNCNTLF